MKIKSGMVSVTFRALEPESIIELSAEAGLEGIEWAGDVHVPPGTLERAEEVGRLTREAGLDVVSYGSYYRVGVSENEGMSFQSVLDTAIALQAPSIRVWAGRGSFEGFSEEETQHIVEETKRIAAMAGQAGIDISFEYHRNTLTETAGSARRLLDAVSCSNVYIYWQPVYGMPAEENIEGMRVLMSEITNIHVFHWWPTNQDRHLLQVGAEDWRSYFKELMGQDGKSRFAMIEFVKDDSMENFAQDAAILRQWLARV